MTKQEFLDLVKQYSNDTIFLSFTERKHPAYVELLAQGQEIVPWLLERLGDSIGRDRGDYMDHDNDPWLAISLLSEITHQACFDNFPEEHAGKLVEVRNHILNWGLKQNAK